jgi:adenylate cyclase
MQTLDEKSASGPTRHPSTGSSGPLLSPDDLASGGAATVIYITARELCVANVGDAMAIMTQSGGDYKILTKKHSPGDPSEIERIREAGGYVSKTGKLNGVLDTSRAFGYFHLMPSVNAAPATHEVKISDQDELLVLASKECWEYISFQSAVDIVRTERNDLMKAAHKLRDFAISYGAKGKIMVMVLAIGDMKKAKNKFRTQSVSLGPGQSFPADDEPVRVNRRKLAKEIGPEDSVTICTLVDYCGVLTVMCRHCVDLKLRSQPPKENLLWYSPISRIPHYYGKHIQQPCDPVSGFTIQLCADSFISSVAMR